MYEVEWKYDFIKKFVNISPFIIYLINEGSCWWTVLNKFNRLSVLKTRNHRYLAISFNYLVKYGVGFWLECTQHTVRDIFNICFILLLSNVICLFKRIVVQIWKKNCSKDSDWSVQLWAVHRWFRLDLSKTDLSDHKSSWSICTARLVASCYYFQGLFLKWYDRNAIITIYYNPGIKQDGSMLSCSLGQNLTLHTG